MNSSYRRQLTTCWLMMVLVTNTIGSASSNDDESNDLYKPQYHFLPGKNWMNDPNGPFYDATTSLFHLMYQYETPRVWGHAISTNMVDWTILPIALNYTNAWYTEVPNETPGVYSGSASMMPPPSSSSSSSSKAIPWLTVSTPTNDMVLLAYPSNSSDPTYSNWSWDTSNPVIYANQSIANTNYKTKHPPGRDPTEVWSCGITTQNPTQQQYCIAYATQQSEGCPCNNISGAVVFSSKYNSIESRWSGWSFQGYLANDTENAVMWECPDFFPLNTSLYERNDDDDNDLMEATYTTPWLLKFSIGPGPSYDKPWGTPGSRDYYVTGSYNSSRPTEFNRDANMWQLAMERSKSVVYDPGAFYASKTFYYAPDGSRILWGWLPEERPTTDTGEPWGWAGAQSLPRSVLSYMYNGSWFVRTPPVHSVVQQLRSKESEDHSTYAPFTITTSSSADDEENDFYYSADGRSSSITVEPLEQTSGMQLQISVTLNTTSIRNGDVCGLRVLSSFDSSGSSSGEGVEYTDISLQFSSSSPTSQLSVSLVVDPSMSNYDPTAEVNRTLLSSAPIELGVINSIRNSLYQQSITGIVKMTVFVDHSVIESYLEEGTRVVTRRVYPADPASAINVQAFASCSSNNNNNNGDDCSASCSFLNVTSYVLRSASIESGYNTNTDDNGDDIVPTDHSSGDAKNERVSTTLTVIFMVICFFVFTVGVYMGNLYWKKRAKTLNSFDGTHQHHQPHQPHLHQSHQQESSQSATIVNVVHDNNKA